MSKSKKLSSKQIEKRLVTEVERLEQLVEEERQRQVGEILVVEIMKVIKKDLKDAGYLLECTEDARLSVVPIKKTKGNSQKIKHGEVRRSAYASGTRAR